MRCVGNELHQGGISVIICAYVVYTRSLMTQRSDCKPIGADLTRSLESTRAGALWMCSNILIRRDSCSGVFPRRGKARYTGRIRGIT